jgi:serine phosphatase RsbU (regulator of sigma subunit)
MLDTAPEESFDRLAQLARDLLQAPFAFITVVDDQRSFWKARLGIEPGAGGAVQNTVAESFCQYVVRSGEPLISQDVRLDPLTAANPSIESMGVVAWAGYPVRSPDGYVLGSFCVVDTVPRTWSERDRRVLETLSQVAATEVALRMSALDAHRQAEAAQAAQRRVQLLAASGELLRAGLDLDAVLAALSRIAVPTLGDAAYVHTYDTGHSIALRPGSVYAQDPEWEAALRADLHHITPSLEHDVGAGYVLRTGRPQLVHLDEVTVATLEEPRARTVRTLGITSALCVPLRAGGRVIGELNILRREGTPSGTPEELALAVELADRAALALDNAALFAEQRDAAIALQQALLSEPVQPDLLQIAVRYLPAAAHAEVGGDWYDAFLQPDGATVVAIGDVVGHDLEAATGMGQLRSMLRVLGYLHGDTPAEVLAGLDEATAGLGTQVLATAVLARVEQSPEQEVIGERTLRWSNAGHPPPLLLHPDGRVEALETEPEPLLGLGYGKQVPRADHTVVLVPGSTLLLFTDGLVERRDRSWDLGLQALITALEELAGEPLESLCDRLVERLLRDTHEDDVALLALRVDPDHS